MVSYVGDKDLLGVKNGSLVMDSQQYLAKINKIFYRIYVNYFPLEVLQKMHKGKP